MGRDAGFLTAASAIAQRFPDDGPHLIYLPEVPFDKEKFLGDVREVYRKYGRCVVAVSEGIKNEDGVPVAKDLMSKIEYDAHGNIVLSSTGALGEKLASYVKENLGISRVRSDTFGYLQRSFMGCVSEVDQHEAREVGEKAAQFALWHNMDGSITIHRTGDYSVDYRLTSLNKVAKYTKSMPEHFINKEGNHVTEAFKNYLRPLIGQDPFTAHMLRAPKVDKILKNI